MNRTKSVATRLPLLSLHVTASFTQTSHDSRDLLKLQSTTLTIHTNSLLPYSSLCSSSVQLLSSNPHVWYTQDPSERPILVLLSLLPSPLPKPKTQFDQRLLQQHRTAFGRQAQRYATMHIPPTRSTHEEVVGGQIFEVEHRWPFSSV